MWLCTQPVVYAKSCCIYNMTWCPTMSSLLPFPCWGPFQCHSGHPALGHSESTHFCQCHFSNKFIYLYFLKDFISPLLNRAPPHTYTVCDLQPTPAFKSGKFDTHRKLLQWVPRECTKIRDSILSNNVCLAVYWVSYMPWRTPHMVVMYSPSSVLNGWGKYANR